MFGIRKNKGFGSSGAPQYMIVGLGNPGAKYELTRHNAGFLFLDALAGLHGIPVKRLKYKALYGDGSIAGARCLLVKPQTFMNHSGEAVRELAQFFKIPMERVIVAFDDISLPVGKLRIRRKGSDGGHNGIKSIIYQTGSDQFPRIKLGVGGKPHPDYDLAAWVLSEFSKEEQKILAGVLDDAAKALELMLQGDVDQAMNRYNG